MDAFCEPALSQIVGGAWNRWWQNPDRLSMDYKRTRATVIHNFMMNLAPGLFADDDGIRLVPGQETTYFVVQQSLVFRIENGRRKRDQPKHRNAAFPSFC